MLFVHPNPLDASAWMYQMAHFSSWFRCIAVDIPGYGHSPRASDGLTLSDLAQACWEVIDETVQGEPAVLVGCSAGTLIVTEMSRLRPSSTRALVLSGTGLWPEADWALLMRSRITSFSARGISFRFGYVLEGFGQSFRETPMARYLAEVFASRDHIADVNSILRQFAAISRPLSGGFFASVSSPTLILSGSEDNSNAFASALQAAIPDCELRVLAGAGHTCHLDRPWEFDGLMIDFLRRREIL